MRNDVLKLDREPGGPNIHALESLRRRAAALLGAPASRIVLAPSLAALQLAGATANEAVTIGPAGAPVCAWPCPDGVEPEGFRKAAEAGLGDIVITVALDALSPAARAAAVTDMRDRDAALEKAAAALSEWAEVDVAQATGEVLTLAAADCVALDRRLEAAGLALAALPDGVRRGVCSDAASARALANRLGAAGGRRSHLRRTTKETDIFVAIDLDRDGPVRIDTGIAFFDHMLDQIPRHGGFALELTATGDLEVDVHHTVEDCCLAFGETLHAALGDKRGIARFGFELPMDEARAAVWIDLSGRPYAKLEGEIPGERVADFPVEMTAHVFRSFAESLKAAIHVRVEGENAHHMVEACFKAFGRALRQAVRIEGNRLPSTKETLA